MSKYISEVFPQTMAHNGEFYPWCHWALIRDPPLPVRWYGVSSGNGNDGVSHMFPDYCVRTDDPYLLAACAMISEWQDPHWAAKNMEIDGEAEYVVSATIYEGPNGETQFGAAEAIIEVFPLSDKDISGRITYDSLEDTFTPKILALAQKTL